MPLIRDLPVALYSPFTCSGLHPLLLAAHWRQVQNVDDSFLPLIQCSWKVSTGRELLLDFTRRIYFYGA